MALQRLPPLPRLSRAGAVRKSAESAGSRLATWFPNPRAGEPGESEWLGRCGKCGEETAAIGLKLVILPFGQGDQWQCGDCAK